MTHLRMSSRTPDAVSFYTDRQLLRPMSMDATNYNSPAHVVATGTQVVSGGPPIEDAVATIALR